MNVIAINEFTVDITETTKSKQQTFRQKHYFVDNLLRSTNFSIIKAQKTFTFK